MAERDIEKQLLEAGKVLHQSPSSADEVLPQLDRVAKLLEKVDQSPSKSMLDALSPIIKAMVEEKLLRNQDEDVRVSVASCISEITRITAPDAPYDDNQMKEVFKLIVSTFEKLADKSSQSYSKRLAILETVAKVRSCVVMLDLECDDLIVEMFQHFLKVIRDNHPDNVFPNMETIMALVLEESEEIGFDILSPLLASLKKDNEEVQPIARKLARNVLVQCAEKIRPCLLEAKNSRNFSVDDYDSWISSICVGTFFTRRDNHKSSGEQQTGGMANGASSGVTTQGDETNLAVPYSAEAPQGQSTKESKADTADGEDPHASVESGQGEDNSVPIETVPEEDHAVPVTVPEQVNPAPVETSTVETNTEQSLPMELDPVEDLPAPATPPKSATSNGVAETENEDVTVGPSFEKHQQTNEDQLREDASVEGKAETVDSDSGKVVEVEPKSAQLSKKSGKRTKLSKKLTVPSESSFADTDTDKVTERTADVNTKPDKEDHASLSRDPSTEMIADEETGKEAEQLSPHKELESEPENAISPSPIGSKFNEARSKKGGKSKKKNRFSKKAPASEDVATKKATEGTHKSEVKLVVRQSGKKAPTKDSPAEKAQVPVKASEDEGQTDSVSDAKPVKTSTKKAEGGGSSSKKKIDDKKRVRGKTASEKETASSPRPSRAVKDVTPLEEETPKGGSSKRKRMPTTGKETDAKKHGGDLVGLKIKVWWPMDETFYEGVVDSYDAKSKKHKVSYTDGEVEDLNLDKERWEKIKDGDAREDAEQETRAGSGDTNPELQKKKKAKIGSEPLAKKGKTESSRDAAASSSKSKGTAKKASGKSVDNHKDDEKLAELTPKSKVRSKKAVGKSTVDSPDTDTEDLEEAPLKEFTKSGAKSSTSKSGSKSSTKVKSSSAKEVEEKEKSPELVKLSKSGKGKSAATPKGKEIEGKSGTTPKKETDVKSGKKRRRNK